MAKQTENREINEFNFTIEGQIEQLDVHTLTNTLLGIDDLINQIGKELGTDEKIELTVKTYKPGSFDIFFQILANGTAIGAATGLFNAQSLSTAKDIISTFSSILNIKKFLKGKEPQGMRIVEGDNYEIINNTGEVYIVKELTINMILDNEKIDSGVKKVFNSINSVPYVKGVTIKDNKAKSLFEAEKSKNDFNVLLKPNPIFKHPDEKSRDVIVDNAIVSVFRIVFTELTSATWKVVYEGNTIEVKIKDADFRDEVMQHKHEFGAGDRLDCNLIIHQKYDEGTRTYQNKSYTITKVNRVLEPEIQTTIKTTKRKKSN